MKKVKKQGKKFNVGDVIVVKSTHTKGKILDFPEWLNLSIDSPLNQSNSYYVRWVRISSDLNVEYEEELRLDRWIDESCKKVEYVKF